MFEIDFNVDDVKELLTVAERSVLPKATTRALNKTIRRVQSQAVKIIAKNFGIVQKEIRPYLRIDKRATWSDLEASIEASGKRIPINKLKPKQTARGVTYRGRDGKRIEIPSAFIQVIRVQDRAGVYKRRSKKRFPVSFLRTVSIPHVMIQDAIAQAMQDVAIEAWGKNFPHEVEYALKQAGFVS